MALPFENNTDRAIKKLARASLRSEGRRNLLAGLIVFGAAFLLSFAAILAVNAALALEVSEGVTSDRELVTVLFGVALVVLLAAGLAGYGLYAFAHYRFSDYLLLRTHFIFFAPDQTAVRFVVDHFAVMGLFACAAHYGGMGLRRFSGRKKET